MSDIDTKAKLGDTFFKGDRRGGDLVYRGYDVRGDALIFKFVCPSAPRYRNREPVMARSGRQLEVSNDEFVRTLQNDWENWIKKRTELANEAVRRPGHKVQTRVKGACRRERR